MGLRGPAPTPTALKVVRGNPGRRPLNKREPKPRDVAPACPEHVKANEDAHREWKRLLPILRRMKVITEADGGVLANLCIVHANLLFNLRKVEEMNRIGKSGMAGVVITTKSGYLAPNQLYINVQNCIEQELKLSRELGLTPSARTRLQTTGAAESADPIEDALCG